MKKLLLINAIVWAALILIASFLFGDQAGYTYFFVFMVFCAGLMNSLIYTCTRSRYGSACKE